MGREEKATKRLQKEIPAGIDAENAGDAEPRIVLPRLFEDALDQALVHDLHGVARIDQSSEHLGSPWRDGVSGVRGFGSAFVAIVEQGQEFPAQIRIAPE